MLKEIIEVTTKLIEFVDEFDQVGNKKRESIAKYFSKIAESLKEVASQLEAGDLPYSAIMQIKDLAEGLPDALGEEIGKEKAMELSALLKQSVGEDLEELKNNQEAIRLIKESSGKFDGLAFRVEYSNSNLFSVKPTIIAFILISLASVITWLVIDQKNPNFDKSQQSQNDTHLPSPTPMPMPSQRLIQTLGAFNIDYSDQAILEQLGNPYSAYPQFAEGCLKLLDHQRPKKKIFFDVIFWNYKEELGGKIHTDSTDGSLDENLLKTAMVEAYSSRYGGSASSFEEIVEPIP